MTAVPVDVFADPDERDLDGLAAWAIDEAKALREVYPAAVEAQWSASPRPKSADEVGSKPKGAHGDPTPSIAMDSRRLALRAQVLRTQRQLREAIIQLRGARIGLERALKEWERDG